jgi:hypothetical protein
MHLFLLIGVAACSPGKPQVFRDALVGNVAVLSDIVLESGYSEAKLDYLIKDDFDGALAVVKKQEAAFDSLILAIEALPTAGVKQGDTLKRAAIEYVAAYKTLQTFDRREIPHRRASTEAIDDDLQQAALDSIVALSHEKQRKFDGVFEADTAYHQALRKFNDLHGL